jgi:hypothetical protein
LIGNRAYSPVYTSHWSHSYHENCAGITSAKVFCRNVSETISPLLSSQNRYISRKHHTSVCSYSLFTSGATSNRIRSTKVFGVHFRRCNSTLQVIRWQHFVDNTHASADIHDEITPKKNLVVDSRISTARAPPQLVNQQLFALAQAWMVQGTKRCGFGSRVHDRQPKMPASCRLPLTTVASNSWPATSPKVVRRCFFSSRHVEILIGLAFAGRHTAQFITPPSFCRPSQPRNLW